MRLAETASYGFIHAPWEVRRRWEDLLRSFARFCVCQKLGNGANNWFLCSWSSEMYHTHEGILGSWRWTSWTGLRMCSRKGFVFESRRSMTSFWLWVSVWIQLRLQYYQKSLTWIGILIHRLLGSTYASRSQIKWSFVLEKVILLLSRSTHC